MPKLIYLYYKERNFLIYGTTNTLVDRFWQGRTNFGAIKTSPGGPFFCCQNWSPRTSFRGDRFCCDRPLFEVVRFTAEVIPYQEHWKRVTKLEL